jgi:CRP-like cAMP-binding protein
MASQDPFRNVVLAAMTADDLAAVRIGLEPVDLPVRYRFAEANRPIEHIYFLESGIASITSALHRELPVEIGLVGAEGLVNLAALLGADRTPNDIYMQVAGSGNRIACDSLRDAMKDRPALRGEVLLRAHLMMLQVAGTAVSNSRATITARLARWLLMAHDRLPDDDVQLTHEFVAIMLGTRRAGVTSSLGDLERAGLVRLGRGTIVILDRQGLRETAGPFYGEPEAEADRMTGGRRKN